jgi:hypothetical protein
LKVFIALAFAAAAGCAVLSQVSVLSPTSIVPPVFFALAFILVLVRMMKVGNRRY